MVNINEFNELLTNNVIYSYYTENDCLLFISFNYYKNQFCKIN